MTPPPSSLIVRYLSGGLLTVVTEYVTFLILYIGLGLGLVPANSVSFVMALIVSFTVNRNLVFKSKKGYKKSQQKQFTYYIVLACINLLVSNILISLFRLVAPAAIAKIGSMIVIAGYNLVIYKTSIFKVKTTHL